MKKLNPLCIRGGLEFAITNRGQLIPCCYCDIPDTLEHPTLKPLLDVSYIKDYESIDDILKTKEWKRFYKNLKNEKNVPPICQRTCGVGGTGKHVHTPYRS